MKEMPDLDELSKAIHEENMKWWQDIETGEAIETPPGRKEMLMISEVGEAMEGLRKDLMDDKLPHRKMAEVEAADYVIRVLDYAAAHKLHVMNYSVPCSDVKRGAEELLLMMCYHAFVLYQTRDASSNASAHQVSECVASARAFCMKHDFDLWAAVHEKRAYNRQREDHKLENRKKDGGKKW